MSDITLRYADLHLYTERGSSSCAAFRSWLDSQKVPFANLDYPSDLVEDALSPLRTWIFANEGVPVDFSSMPVLVYKDVLWEAPDGSDRYDNVYYALSQDDLPNDFLEKLDRGVV